MPIFTLYQYTNRMNGKRYIGVTNDISRREKAHAAGTSKALAFNAAMKKYGRAAFDFCVLAVFDTVLAAAYHEQAAIVAFGTLAPAGYNLRAGAPFTLYSGMPSVETRAKIGLAMSVVLTGHVHTAEARANMSAAQKGHAAWNKGKSPTPETRAKVSATMKGRPGHNKGKHATAETLSKMSAAHMGIHPTPETRAKLRAARAGRVISDKTRAKLSATMKAYWEKVKQARDVRERRAKNMRKETG